MSALNAIAIKFSCLLFAYLGINALFYSIARADSERPCPAVVKALSDKYEKGLRCARLNCPDFRIRDIASESGQACLKGCESENPEEELVPYSEIELTRCFQYFKSSDEKDFFTIGWCMTASKAVAEVVEPFSICMHSKACAEPGKANSEECVNQCKDDQTQVVEVATSTLERCAGIPTTEKAICTMLQKTINACTTPEHCDRLVAVLNGNCPSLDSK